MLRQKRTVFRYEVSYTGVSPGLQRLYGRGSDVNNHILHVLRMREYAHSQYPFTMTACSDPTQLSLPVRVITDLNGPYGIAFNSRGEMIVSEELEDQISVFNSRGDMIVSSEHCENKISVFNISGERIRTIRSRDDCPEEMEYPRSMAIDDADNIYVCSRGQLQKFTSSGELKCVRKISSNEVEFNPHGITLHNNYVYVCDNHCIRVFDLDLNFIKTIGSHGKGKGEFDSPKDIKFDASGHMYVADLGNGRVQVLDSSGQFIRVFGEEQREPYGLAHLHIIDKYVYASLLPRSFLLRSVFNVQDTCCIVVYKTSGEFVTSFGGEGYEDGEEEAVKFWLPASIASCPNGSVYVCDWFNNNVVIF